VTPDEWDALCDRCAKCCIIKNSSYACPSLNVKTKRCTKYATRVTSETCLPVMPGNVETLHARGVLPDSCAYVRHAQNKAPLEEIPEVPMVAYALAPLKFRRSYERERKRWLEAVNAMLESSACQASEGPSTQVPAREAPAVLRR